MWDVGATSRAEEVGAFDIWVLTPVIKVLAGTFVARVMGVGSPVAAMGMGVNSGVFVGLFPELQLTANGTRSTIRKISSLQGRKLTR